VELIDSINGVLWGWILIILLVGAGLYLTCKTGFLQFRKFSYMWKNTIMSMFSPDQRHKDDSGVSPFQAVATAMAGTIGTGSIAGLATAIGGGGPGAVFWMWISALLGMVTKYSEIVLSLKFREKNEKGEWVGGPMYYIKNGLGMKWLASAFCVFGMIACLGTGNATQSNSIALALKDIKISPEKTFTVEPWVTGLVLTLLAAAVILGGMKRISSVNEKLVPFMAMFYVALSLVALVIRWDRIPQAFAMIFREAFNFRAAAGGVAGYGIMLAMKNGFSRGVFSNEAGLGSAPIAHAASTNKDPVRQGLWGMFEVFFTTIIICTISALIILTGDFWQSGEYQGAALSIASFNEAIPYAGGWIVTVSTIFFALSTILGWAYYGEVCIGYLTGKSKKAINAYRIIYVAFVFVGAVGNLDLIWGISEMMNGLMAIPNLIGVIGLSGVIVAATNEHFKKTKSKNK